MKGLFNSLIILFIILIGCNDQFSTPESTIHYYYQSLEKKDIQAVRLCFRDGKFSANALGKFWIEYKITEIKKYDSQAVEKFKNTINFDYMPDRDPIEGDIEIIVTDKVKMKNNNQIKEFQFWYLLRKIKGKWLIISHSAVNSPD